MARANRRDGHRRTDRGQMFAFNHDSVSMDSMVNSGTNNR
jgi:hypothetical protein